MEINLPLSMTGLFPFERNINCLPAMQPVLLYYVNLLLCGIVCLELLFTFRKNSMLKLYFLLIVGSLFVMNYFVVTGVTTRPQFILAKFARLIYVCSTLLALVRLVQQKIPRWLNGLILFSVLIITGMRLALYNQINIEALPNVPNPVFSVGGEFYSAQPVPRYITLALAMLAIIVAYYYYRRLLMKLNMESAQYTYLLLWIISLVVPFFMLTIFGILGNLQIFNEIISSYLFAFFSCSTVCSFILRPRFLDKDVLQENSRNNSRSSLPTLVL